MRYLIFIYLILFSSLIYPQITGGFIAADTPGAYGSYWHTSLTLTNGSGVDVTIPVTLYLSNGSSYKFDVNVPPMITISKLLIDLLKEKGIEIQNFFGWVEVELSNIPENFIGETIMYTPDPNAGEGAIFAERTELFLGKGGEVFLYPLTPCGKDAKEPMELGGALWRTNIGFVNLSSVPIVLKVQCYDGNFSRVIGRDIQISLNPKEIKQLNDVRRPEIWDIKCELIKEPVICFVENEEANGLFYVYGANNNNVNNFPIYISPQEGETLWK